MNMKNLLIICLIAGMLFTIASFNKKSKYYREDYMVVTASTISQLRTSIRENYSDYDLVGGVSYGNGVYIQAMVK